MKLEIKNKSKLQQLRRLIYYTVHDMKNEDDLKKVSTLVNSLYIKELKNDKPN